MQSTPDTDPSRSEDEQPYLLVLVGESSRMIKLPADGTVLIGRSQQCDVRIDDALVSRQHARVDIADGDAILVELPSKTGTQVNGETLAGARVLLTGDLVSIGSATLVFHGGRRVQPLVNVVEFPRFRARLREELERTHRSSRPFAVACIDLGRSVERRRVLAALGRLLRPIDAVAWAGDTQLFAVLPECGRPEAGDVMAAMLAAMTALVDSVRLGHAVCLVDGTDVDTLLAGARHAAMSARGGSSAPSRALRYLKIGQHDVLLADPAMSRVYALIEKLAAVNLPILISGETGTGKELAALALHEQSPRRAARFAAVNCAALPEALLESELFGHERGAFSGAVAAKPGILEDATGGTVFLDEIGEMPLPAQAKLLRVLETGQVTRLGDLRQRAIDIRFVAATNRDLQEEVRQSRFRQDLFFRLNGAHIRLPGLRERPTELALLAQLFLEEGCARAGHPSPSLSRAALEALAAHRWPGNVRELKNVMQYVAATCREPEVEPWHFEDRLVGEDRLPATDPAPGGRRFRPLAEEVRELERKRISEALDATGGNQTRAAAMLEVPLRTFYDRVKTLGLSPRRRTNPG